MTVRPNSDPLRYLYHDHLRSTIYATHDGGTPLTNQRYYAFGKLRLAGTLPTDHWFTGQKINSGNGLYYYGARYYDPELGQFLSPDTLVPDPGNVLDYNRYGYARFNPLKYNDPTGHQTDDLIDDDERPAGSGAIVKGSVTGNANPLDADVADTAPSTSTRANQPSNALQPNPATNQTGGLTPDAVITTSDYVRGISENQIGNWGVQQAAQVFPFEVGQFRVRKPNQPDRIYDGRIVLGLPDDESMISYVDVIHVEVKTSTTKPSISLSGPIKQQIEFDAGMESQPMWIFVGARPSAGLIEQLDNARIVWHVVIPEPR